MSGIAFVFHQSGVLMLPAMRPYDPEVLFEEIAWYAKRDHEVRFELNAHHWLVLMNEHEPPGTCAVCDRRLTRLTYVNDERDAFCAPCGREWVRTDRTRRRPPRRAGSAEQPLAAPSRAVARG